MCSGQVREIIYKGNVYHLKYYFFVMRYLKIVFSSMYVCVYECVYMSVLANVFTCWRPAASLASHFFRCLPLSFLRHCPLRVWKSPAQPSSCPEVSGPTCLCFPSVGNRSLHTTPSWPAEWLWGPTQVSGLCSGDCTRKAPLPAVLKFYYTGHYCQLRPL